MIINILWIWLTGETKQPASDYTGQPVLACTSSLEDFVDAKFYCLHAVADRLNKNSLACMPWLTD